MSQLHIFEKLINDFVDNKKDLSMEQILEELFASKAIADKYLNPIRKTTMIGQIANEILARLGRDESVEIRAIGDIDYPQDLFEEWSKLCNQALESVDYQNLVGYDINAQGSLNFRGKLYEHMKIYYDLEDFDLDDIVNLIVPAYGGIDAFATVLEGLKVIYGSKNLNFIYPEASFSAILELAKTKLDKESCISIEKPSTSNFFLSKDQIDKLYKNTNVKSKVNLYYITPVGNPTGEKIDENVLYDIIAYINQKDFKGIFILDNVYVRLLEQDQSKLLFKNIFADKSIRDQLVICESFSKTFGTTGIRCAWFWGFNPNLLEEIKKVGSLNKAGFSKILAEFMENLLDNQEQLVQFQEKSYAYWSEKRLEMFAYLKKNFSDLFEFEQIPAVREREGIYILLKIKEACSPEEVYAKTGILGVPIFLSDGVYIRYAFGNVK